MLDTAIRTSYWHKTLRVVKVAGPPGLLLLLALAFRLWHFDRVSVWYDDYQSIAYLKAPSLHVYLALARLLNPDHVPGYFLLQYAWSRITCPTAEWIRILSILLSAACIPLVYGMGSIIYGRRAAALAAFLAAISPLHIWYAHAFRYNSLECLFILVSLLALLKAIEGRANRWWFVNVASNCCLLWIHILSGALLFAELLFVGFMFRRRFRFLLAWGSPQFVAACLALGWIHQTSAYTVSLEEDYFAVRSIDIFVNAFGYDATGLSQWWMYFSSSRGQVPHHPPEVGHLTDWFSIFSWGLVAFFFVAACVLPVIVYTRRKDASARPLLTRGTVLLFLVAFVPVLFLAAVTRLIRPCLIPSYTLYSAFALYLFVGACIASARRIPVRIALMTVLLLLYGYQVSLQFPEATRTDWQGAAERVKDDIKPEDLVLVRGRFFAIETFRFAMGTVDTPVMSAYTLRGAADKCRLFLESSPGNTVWTVIEISFDYPPLPLHDFEALLAARGLEFSREILPGMGGLAVYKIRQGKTPCQEIAIPAAVDYAALAQTLRLPEDDDTKFRLGHVVETAPPCGSYTYALFALAAADEGCLDIAEAAAVKAIELNEASPLAYFALAVVKGEKRSPDEMKAAFVHAEERDKIGVMALYAPLFRELYDRGDLPKARGIFDQLNEWGAFLPMSIRGAVGEVSRFQPLRLCVGDNPK